MNEKNAEVRAAVLAGRQIQSSDPKWDLIAGVRYWHRVIPAQHSDTAAAAGRLIRVEPTPRTCFVYWDDAGKPHVSTICREDYVCVTVTEDVTRGIEPKPLVVEAKLPGDHKYIGAEIPAGLAEEGWRRVCTLDGTFPSDTERYYGPVIGGWDPTLLRGVPLKSQDVFEGMYRTRRPIPTIPEPELPPGVTWLSRELTQDDLARGYRRICSADVTIPDDTEFVTPDRGRVEPSAARSAPLTQYVNFIHNVWLRTKEPLPPEALPVTEPVLPAGHSWEGGPLSQEDLDAGYRRLCTLDKTIPMDCEYWDLIDLAWAPTRCSGIPKRYRIPTDSKYWNRTKAPLPKVTEPELPAGAEYVTPELPQSSIDAGFRRICSLDKFWPDDTQYSGDGGKTWKDSYARRTPVGDFWDNMQLLTRTKTPIPGGAK